MIRGLARLAVSNPVGSNLLMIALAVGGLVSYAGTPREVFPDFSLDAIEVFTTLPGAAPVDVERLVTTPIEDALDGLDGVKEMRSTSREGVSRIKLTLTADAEPIEVLAGARDRVRGGGVVLPEDAEEPFVQEVENRFPVIAVFVYGSADPSLLKRLAEDEARGLESLPGVANVQATGLIEPRLWVEVDPDALERHGLDFTDVERAVATRVAEAPLGALVSQQKERLLRIGGDVQWARDLASIPVRVSATGAEVRLDRVAEVTESVQRGSSRARFNGWPCVHLQVQKDASGDTIDIAGAVHEYVASRTGKMPPGVAIGTNSDLSIYVETRLRTMFDSGAIGAILVLVALLLFLSTRVALVTALGIPISFLGGLIVAGSLGVTMNMISMFALIVVLGMIVDDAIVVGENVYRRMEEGETPEVAAVEGTAEVGRAVVATILTSIAAFLPVLMLTGTNGLFLRPLPLVVSACLVVSLVEAFTILPAHLAHWTSKRAVARMQAEARSSGGRVRRWYTPVEEAYMGLLRGALRWRYATLSFALGVGAIVAAVGFARIPFTLFDDFESKLFYISARLDPSSSIEETEAVCEDLEARVRAVGAGEVLSMHTLLGVAASDVSTFELGPHLGQVWVELREGEGRRRTTAEMIEDLRAALDGLPPVVESYEIAQPQSGPIGRAVEVALRGPDLDVLSEEAAALADRLKRFSGVRDVRTDLESGKRQVTLRMADAGRQVGLAEADLATQVRTAFEGKQAASLRRGAEDVEVVVKYPEDRREERGALRDLRVALPAVPGEAPARVPLHRIAHVDEGVGPSSVGHEERLRAVVVSADVDETAGNAARILEEVGAGLAGGFGARPGYSYRLRGQAEETAESLAGLASAGVISGLLIYMILGTLFGSFLQPLVIMFIIPFAGVGMVLGHLVMDRSITLMSLIGLLALTGVVVNDSLILVDFVGQRRRAGAGFMEAVLESGRLRFRPIVLTSVTTMLGLAPLTFFASGQARYLQPMAISIFFGLAVATLLILVLVPVASVILEDLLGIGRGAGRRAGRLMGAVDEASMASSGA